MATIRTASLSTANGAVTVPNNPFTPSVQAVCVVDPETGGVAAANADSAALITATGATTTQTSPDQTNANARGVKVVLNMTAVGTGSVTLSIQGKDAASGAYYTILTGAAVVANGVTVYTIYPGVTAAANSAVADVIPRTWRVLVTANNVNPTSYTVGASLML